MLDRVALKQMEPTGRSRDERFLEVLVEVAVLFDGPDLSAGFEEGASQRLEIHSPSRTMARIGEMAAQGLMDGTEKGAAAAPAQQAGASGPLVEISQINVGGAFSDPETAGQAISRVIEREVIALFQRKALEG